MRCASFIAAWLVAGALSLPQDVVAFDKLASSAVAHYIMGVIYDDTGEPDKAIDEYLKALKTDNDVSTIHVDLATSYIKKNDITGAQRELDLASSLDPEAIKPHAILALLYSLENKLEQAKKEYETALKNASRKQPANLDIYRSLAAFYLQTRNFSEAQEIYRIILEKSPNDAQAYFYLGSIFNELKDFPQAERELKRSIELKPDYAEAMNFLGYIYVEKNKDLRRAEAMIKKAVEIEPDNGAYIDSLGWCYYKLGAYKDALEQLKRAAALIEDPVVLDHLGDTYLLLKDNANAQESWQKSLRLNPLQEKVKEKILKLK